MSRTINTIVIHCAATGGDVDIETVRRWHVDDNGWSDVGYHHLIRFNGQVEKGRDHEVAGAHARGYNEHSLGICLAGGLNPKEGYTAAQWKALEGLCRDLLEEYPIDKVIGHNQVDTTGKTCPNFSVEHWSSTLI